MLVLTPRIGGVMARTKITPPDETGFAKRLAALRKARGVTQIQLAELIGSTQRNISHYETAAGYPPAPVLASLAKALDCSTDELLGVPSRFKTAAKTADPAAEDPALRRLWKKFQQVAKLPEKDQRAVVRLVNSLAHAAH